MKIPVVVQYRHLHLNAPDLDKLFGPGTILHAEAKLGHRGQVVYKETVTVAGKRGSIEKVRILGPVRGFSQLELAPSDALAAGIEAPLRSSGDSARAGTFSVIGPSGKLTLSVGIIPVRHLHCSPAVAAELHLAHHSFVNLLAPLGEIEEVLVRVHPTFGTELHLTADEAAELWLSTGDLVTLA